MNWIERYVAEVTRYLPARRRDDVGEELQSLLEEELHAREVDRERPLEKEEVLAFLREFGHPMRVAARYGAGGSLVGETLFPLYRKVVSYILLAVGLVYVLSVVWGVLGDIIWVTIAEGQPAKLGLGFAEAWQLAVNWLVFITLGFHLAERYLVQHDGLEYWNPATLPPASMERASLMGSLLICALVSGWLIFLDTLSPTFSIPVLLGDGENRFVTLIAWLKIQAVLVLAVYLVLAFRPYWSRGKRMVIILSDLLTMGGVAICLSLSPNGLLVHYPRLPEDLTELSTVILWIWLLGLLVDMLVQGYRLLEARNTSTDMIAN
ncbi:MAG: hypothetical protein WD406_08065 [Pseudohongiellaceae bacterium]